MLSQLKHIWITLGAVFFVTLGVYFGAKLGQPSPLELKTSFEFPESQNIAPFSLTDQYGKPFNNARLLGKWSLIFIGFTACPDVCPTTMSKLAAAYPKLNENGPLQVIFISVDPQRDTTEVLRDYAQFFHPEFIAATGEHSQLFPFTRNLGFIYTMVGEGDNYQVDHSASFVLISPQGEKVAVIKPTSSTTGHLPQIKNSDLIHDIDQLTTKHSY